MYQRGAVDPQICIDLVEFFRLRLSIFVISSMDTRVPTVRHSDALLDDQNQELAQFVNNILKDMQDRFNNMTESVLSKIDDMGSRIDELEKSVNEILINSGDHDTKSCE